VIPYFKYRPTMSRNPWKDLVIDVNPPVTSVSDDTMTVSFEGNRVDIVASDTAEGSDIAMDVFIDGKRPSEISSLYVFTRPNGDASGEWINKPNGLDWPWQVPTIFGMYSRAPLVAEEWTLTFGAIDRTVEPPLYHFYIQGSVTGNDGDGVSDEEFVSRSGRIVIPTDAWFVYDAEKSMKKNVSPGYTIRWKSVLTGTDTCALPPPQNPAIERAITLFHGIENGTHELKLVKRVSGAFPAFIVRAYKPPFKEVSWPWD
jgi:hypothetical protein